jgi:hypothetical protein
MVKLNKSYFEKGQEILIIKNIFAKYLKFKKKKKKKKKKK